MKLSDDALCDRFDRYGALYMLATRWHGGQWSPLYRIQSRLIGAGYSPGLTVSEGRGFESENQRWYYQRYLRCVKDRIKAGIAT